MTWIEKAKPIWLFMLIMILFGNFTLYQSSFGLTIMPEETQFVVLGSLVDFVILAPLFTMLYLNKFTLKTTIMLSALGCVLLRFLIPSSLLEPYEAITWIGIMAEGGIILLELLLIVTFVRYMPKIIGDVKESRLPVVFSFSQAVDHYVRNHPVIQMICSESLMFYYAFASWKKVPRPGITLYKKSSYIALQIMMIHAIVIETIGIHYWLHDKAPILSIILLLLNIYSVIFFLADIQALRLNPIHFDKDAVYLSLGLMKRTQIDYSNVECIIDETSVLEQKLSKDTADFTVRDFEKVYPDFILKMKTPQKVVLFMGIEKKYDYIAIKSDSPSELKELFKVNNAAAADASQIFCIDQKK
ncbi:beta-carotene 15,15'-monooxygenase [Planococcus donghaensis]|uniref:beta-carotene 15,15'-monooxygenase n=1 Tax=Planococcus donghaensis TaxID=414778 RepID=UPI0037354699